MARTTSSGIAPMLKAPAGARQALHVSRVGHRELRAGDLVDRVACGLVRGPLRFRASARPGLLERIEEQMAEAHRLGELLAPRHGLLPDLVQGYTDMHAHPELRMQ